MKFNGSGIAAVVGTNGCGKSNLSDAISWVLGEQSAKSLRGARMEDVIFAGTRERKPLGMASVTMTLVDPAADAEPAPITLNGHSNVMNGHSLVNGNVHTETNGHANVAVHPPEKKHPSEITITRRLFRSGDSEYLINGRTARLRDIQDLFMAPVLDRRATRLSNRAASARSSRPSRRTGAPSSKKPRVSR